MRQLFAGLLVGSMLPGASLALTFEDVSTTAGFTPQHFDSVPAGGIAVADFSGNGFPDIFVTGGQQHPNRLYWNQGDGTFTEDTAASLQGENCSVAAAGDFNNDGWPDIYVGCRWSDNLLLQNLNGAGFANVISEDINHATPCCVTTRTDALAWGDLTGNGYLDLYVGIFTGGSNTSNPDNLDRILLNNGDGTWTNAAASLDPEVLIRPGLAVVISDITGNGRPDIYVINDKLAGNVLWRNDGPGCGGWCFSDISTDTGTGLEVYGMGIAIGDVNRNGLWDLYFSSIDAQHLLHGVSADPLLFEENTDSPLNYLGVGWGTLFADFDNDGWEDAFLAIGSGPFSDTPDVDQIFRNLGNGLFETVTQGSGLDLHLPTQAAARIDFERNGRTDLVLHHWNQDPGFRLYRNVTPDPGKWIGFELEGGGPVNRDAIGTLVVIETADGSAQRRELRGGESRGASHDRVLHFGLGAFDSADVTVRWPDGLVQQFPALSAGQYHKKTYPSLFKDRFEQATEDP